MSIIFSLGNNNIIIKRSIMNLLSLFNGISGGMLACERAGLKIDKHYASEIDKYANQITMKNYPKTVMLGDVTKWKDWELPKIDLMIWGSPCQDLSIAGKDRQGLDGARSGLFWEAVKIWQKVKPKYWIMENVASMSQEAKAMISWQLGVEPIMINSALVSAQQRKRLYWTNIPVEQPKDKGIFLKDILESDICEKDKSYCIDACYYKGINIDQYLEKSRRKIVFQPLATELKSYALTTKYSGYSFPHDFIKHKKSCVFQPIRLGQIGKGGQGQRVYSVHGKTISLSANGGGQGDKTGLYKIDLPDGYYTIRKLTPIECERLQTYPDNFTEGISNTQRYKTLGNSFTIDVIVHIITSINFKQQ
jgi:DNA (cytosine-5)-methyltransferase 3A